MRKKTKQKQIYYFDHDSTDTPTDPNKYNDINHCRVNECF